MDTMLKAHDEAERAESAAQQALDTAEKIRAETEELARQAAVDAAREAAVDAAREAAVDAAREAAIDAARDTALEAAQEAADEAVARKMDAIDNLIPQFEKILDSKTSDSAKRDESIEQALKLFKSLRALGESLPDPPRKDFLQSSNRIKMDYIIGRLSGKKGLLKTSQDLRDSGAVPDYVKETDIPSIVTGRRLASIVLKDMHTLSQELEDKDLSIGLSKIVANLTSRL